MAEMEANQVSLILLSTDSDMFAERAYFYARIYPQLLSQLDAHGLSLSLKELFIDHLDGDPIRLMTNLEALDASASIAIGFFGQKGLSSQKAILETLLQKKNPAFCYFRQPDYLKDLAKSNPALLPYFTEASDPKNGPLAQMVSASVKAKRTRGFFAHAYAAKWASKHRSPEFLIFPSGPALAKGRLDPHSFKVDGLPLDEVIRHEVVNLLRERFPEHFARKDLSLLEKEAVALQRYLSESEASYVPSPRLDLELESFLTSKDSLLVLSGALGAGKSAALAHLCFHHQQDPHFLPFFFGRASFPKSFSSFLSSLIHRLYPEVKDEDLPLDTDELELWLSKALIAKPHIDALLLLDNPAYLNSDPSFWTAFLGHLPLKIIVSEIPSSSLDFSSLLKLRSGHLLPLPPFSLEQRQALIAQWSKASISRLDEASLEGLMNLKAATPLLLQVGFDELKNENTVEERSATLKALGTGLDSALSLKLARLQGKSPSSSAYRQAAPLMLALLACSPLGLQPNVLACAYLSYRGQLFDAGDPSLDLVYRLLLEEADFLRFVNGRIFLRDAAFANALKRAYAEKMISLRCALSSAYFFFAYSSLYDFPELPDILDDAPSFWAKDDSDFMAFALLDFDYLLLRVHLSSFKDLYSDYQAYLYPDRLSGESFVPPNDLQDFTPLERELFDLPKDPSGPYGLTQDIRRSLLAIAKALQESFALKEEGEERIFSRILFHLETLPYSSFCPAFRQEHFDPLLAELTSRLPQDKETPPMSSSFFSQQCALRSLTPVNASNFAIVKDRAYLLDEQGSVGVYSLLSGCHLYDLGFQAVTSILSYPAGLLLSTHGGALWLYDAQKETSALAHPALKEGDAITALYHAYLPTWDLFFLFEVHSDGLVVIYQNQEAVASLHLQGHRLRNVEVNPDGLTLFLDERYIAHLYSLQEHRFLAQVDLKTSVDTSALPSLYFFHLQGDSLYLSLDDSHYGIIDLKKNLLSRWPLKNTRELLSHDNQLFFSQSGGRMLSLQADYFSGVSFPLVKVDSFRGSDYFVDSKNILYVFQRNRS
jgi:hypothetical protein